MAHCNPKSRIQERASSVRPKLGEFKQVFRARVAQRGKDLRHQRAMEARMNKTAVGGDDDCAMEEETDDGLDLRAWLHQQWLQFADEEGIGALTDEEAAELYELQEELFKAEKAEHDNYLLEFYEYQQRMEELALIEQIEAYERERVFHQ